MTRLSRRTFVAVAVLGSALPALHELAVAPAAATAATGLYPGTTLLPASTLYPGAAS